MEQERGAFKVKSRPLPLFAGPQGQANLPLPQI
jgi:hypothetical protein